MNGPTVRELSAPSGASAIIDIFDTFTPETREPELSTAVTRSVQPEGRSKSCGIDMSIFCATVYAVFSLFAFGRQVGLYPRADD